MDRREIYKSLYNFRKLYNIDIYHQRNMQIVHDAAMVLNGVKQICRYIDIVCQDQDTFKYIQAVSSTHAVPYRGDENCLYVPITEHINMFGPINKMAEAPVCSDESDIYNIGDPYSIWMVQTNVSLLKEDQDDIKLLRRLLEMNQAIYIEYQ